MCLLFIYLLYVKYVKEKLKKTNDEVFLHQNPCSSFIKHNKLFHDSSCAQGCTMIILPPYDYKSWSPGTPIQQKTGLTSSIKLLVVVNSDTHPALLVAAVNANQYLWQFPKAYFFFRTHINIQNHIAPWYLFHRVLNPGCYSSCLSLVRGVARCGACSTS